MGSGTEMSDSFAGSLPSCAAAYRRSASTCRKMAICCSSLAWVRRSLIMWGRRSANSPSPSDARSLPPTERVDLPEWHRQKFHALVPLDLVVALLVHQDGLRRVGTILTRSGP